MATAKRKDVAEVSQPESYDWRAIIGGWIAISGSGPLRSG